MSEVCQRPECRHPKLGAGREGHFVGPGRRGRWGEGPCKVKGCSCPAFLGGC